MIFDYGKNGLLSLLCAVSALFLLFLVQMNRNSLGDLSNEMLLFVASFMLTALGLLFGITCWRTIQGKIGIIASIILCLFTIIWLPSIQTTNKTEDNKINIRFPRTTTIRRTF